MREGRALRGHLPNSDVTLRGRRSVRKGRGSGRRGLSRLRPGSGLTCLLVLWVWVGRGLARGNPVLGGGLAGVPPPSGGRQRGGGVSAAHCTAGHPAVLSSRRRCGALTPLSPRRRHRPLVAPSWACGLRVPCLLAGMAAGVGLRGGVREQEGLPSRTPEPGPRACLPPSPTASPDGISRWRIIEEPPPCTLKYCGSPMVTRATGDTGFTGQLISS